MTTYVIGDLQGCLDPLKRLLDQVKFDPENDRLWFAGDLVNRGPQSLATLRYVRDLGPIALSVLGNHDLHLLAVKAGFRKESPKDTLSEILSAPDADELCDWLRQRPLLVYDQDTDCTLVHAGLHPDWDLTLAQSLASEVEQQLRSEHYLEFLHAVYNHPVKRWDTTLTGISRWCIATSCFTRMRYLTHSGDLDFSCAGPPSDAAANLIPWYAVPKRKNDSLTILFGHWSSLGTVDRPRLYALDKGCVWGRSLAALSLDDFSLHEVPCAVI